MTLAPNPWHYALEKILEEQNTPKWKPLPHQLPPPGIPGEDWYFWCLLGGRGTGKTEGATAYVNEHVLGPPCDPRVPGGHRIGIVAPTLGDAFESVVDGPSGLKAHNPAIRSVTRQGGSYVIWPNGAEGKLFGSFTPEDVERLRSGGNRCLYMAEEVAAWRQLSKSWPHMRYGLRIGPRPHIVGATTPKARKFLINLLHAERTVTTHGTTDQNPHLAQSVRDELYKDYAGTRLGRQELLGEILTDTPGAIATLDQLDAGRVWELPKLDRVIVSVDPAITNTDESDETGITAQGRAGDHVFFIADKSLKADVDDWAMEAVVLAVEGEVPAGMIIYEANQGSDAIGVVLKNALKRYNEAHSAHHVIVIKPVSAKLSKYDRALPMQQAIQQERYHIYGSHSGYEGQLTTWVPDSPADEDSHDKKGKKDKSPDRMDSGVHGFRELMGIGGKGRTSGRQIAAARIG